MAISKNEYGEFDVVENTKNIYDFFESRGFTFPREVITRYVLSVQTKPFVILTGISGTGKTKIAQLFAEYAVQDQISVDRKERIAFISVRPDWLDSRGLLGFHNLLDDSYHATPLLHVLLAAANGDATKPSFVILDEMNLARVEQYFSDFLSVMESRTPDNPRGEWIRLHAFQDGVKTRDGLVIPQEIQIPPQVVFTGTVNVDESTYMFSPKVLDRANVIEFNDVQLDDDLLAKKDSFVFKEEFQYLNQLLPLFGDFRPPSLSDFDEADRKNPKYRARIKELLEILKPFNLHFGYRVISEMSRFLLIAQRTVNGYRFEDAFDIQILQKILPKFHGTQAKLKEPLERLLAFCWGEELSLDDDVIDRVRRESANAVFPRAANKVANMLHTLEIQGYCSFIE